MGLNPCEMWEYECDTDMWIVLRPAEIVEQLYITWNQNGTPSDMKFTIEDKDFKKKEVFLDFKKMTTKCGRFRSRILANLLVSFL